MRSSRAEMFGVSSSSCLSLVVRNGSDDAIKSASRPGSSMLIAIVCRSSDSVGDELTICWNWLTTFRCSASVSGVAGGSISSTVSHSAVINGVIWANSPSRTRSLPSVNTNRLWLGIFTTLCTVARVPMWCRSAACGESWRASRCATTRMVFSSPRDWISWMELSRPTVSGSTACGKSTVSRTGRTGIGCFAPAISGSSGDFVVGFMTLTKSPAIDLILECTYIRFPSFRCMNLAKVATASRSTRSPF